MLVLKEQGSRIEDPEAVIDLEIGRVLEPIHTEVEPNGSRQRTRICVVLLAAPLYSAANKSQCLASRRRTGNRTR